MPPARRVRLGDIPTKIRALRESDLPISALAMKNPSPWGGATGFLGLWFGGRGYRSNPKSLALMALTPVAARWMLKMSPSTFIA